MPWHVEERGGEFCVIKDSDGSSAGCHSSREKANSQLRALYANEPSMSAALELDTTALMEEFFPDPEPQRLQIEVGNPNDKMLYSLVSSLAALSERLVSTEERQQEFMQKLMELSDQMSSDREDLTNAITAAVSAQLEPVVNVTVPEPVVNITIPEFEFPDIPAPVVNVQPPEVNITYTPPTTSKQIKVTRDPITGSISSAEVTDG